MEKSSNINELRVSRIKELIKREGIKQIDLADELDMEPQNLSRCLKKGKVSEKTCHRIHEHYPEYRVEWLMGYDDFMTTEDLKKHYVSFTDQTNDASLTMLDHSLRTICMIKGIKAPVIDNIPEILFLQAQLKDYSDHLMRDYLDRINGNNTSHVWDFLDQLPDNSNSDHNSENIKSEQKTGEKS